ncbi:MAG: WXG100 family type VII secretion target, partial [Parasporobacterium sp.]|nr:WXG100 family type VII secretion target [Parasporobacterium sp.]
MTFDVELPYLGSAADQLKEKVQNLIRRQQTLYQALKDLDSMWEGESHDLFWDQYDKDSSYMTQLFANLDRIADQAKNACQEYNNCEQNVV